MVLPMLRNRRCNYFIRPGFRGGISKIKTYLVATMEIALKPSEYSLAMVPDRSRLFLPVLVRGTTLSNLGNRFVSTPES